MEFTGRLKEPRGLVGPYGWRTFAVEVWRCTRRRWWNWWKHPLEYMLPERR